MAHIEYRLGEFTGQVGPVRFRKGHAETDDRDMVAFFVEQPETYDVTDTDEPAPKPKPKAILGKG